MKSDNYITTQEAAEILNVSSTTIRNFLLKKHYFKGKRFGKQLRIDRESFMEYVKHAEITA